MKTVINTHKFNYLDERFIDFFNNHGWVVISNVLNKNKVNKIHSQYENMKNEEIKDIKKEGNININIYSKVITQWRDLWFTEGGALKDCIFDDKGIHGLAQKAMKWTGIKLLHDHIVVKPSNIETSTIPWHQDSMFWPVDMVGCSALTALSDVKVQSGCLEVINYSHLSECEKPIDFMMKEKNDFSKDSTCVQLPLEAGDTILLSSLCYHRSSDNKTLADRPMHISLWVHPSTNWRPDLVDWHPINDSVETEPNEELQGKMFPSFGSYSKLPKPKKDIHTGTEVNDKEISMFNASKIICKQILDIQGVKKEKKHNLENLLNNKEKRQQIIHKMLIDNIYKDKEYLDKLLSELWLCAFSYNKNKSRNIFNSTFAKWDKVMKSKSNSA